jgi:hypothetical protein
MKRPRKLLGSYGSSSHHLFHRIPRPGDLLAPNGSLMHLCRSTPPAASFKRHRTSSMHLLRNSPGKGGIGQPDIPRLFPIEIEVDVYRSRPSERNGDGSFKGAPLTFADLRLCASTPRATSENFWAAAMNHRVWTTHRLKMRMITETLNGLHLSARAPSSSTILAKLL